ncbi:MAG TPA: right-handed parallel beta-helix repeat-containing protein [Myxococcales bacterium]|jgi:parallel beta-helix repeat protein
MLLRSPRPGGLVALLAALALPGPAAAATYYVESSGKDTNDGSSTASALQTLQAAVDKCVSGSDHIEVGGGSFAGFRIANKTGIEVFGIATTTIDQSGASTGTNGIVLEGVDTVTLKGLTIQNLVGAGLIVTGAAPSRNLKLLNLSLTSNGANDAASNLVVNDTTGLLLRGVQSTSGGRSGIYLKGVTSGSVETCTASYNPVAGIWVNRSSDVNLERNTVHHNSTSGKSEAGILVSGVAVAKLRNNLVFRNEAFGISVEDDGSGNPSTGVVLAGNTVFQHDQGDFCVRVMRSNPVRIFDNILLHAGPDSGSLYAIGGAPAESDYNLFSDRFQENVGGANQSLADWQAGHPALDQNSANAAASLFDDVSKDHFWFKNSGSTGVDRGCGRHADVVDYLGNPRPQGVAYDIGCYELPQVGPDAGVPDAAAPPGEDAAQPGEDAAEPGVDAAEPGLDAALPGPDASAPDDAAMAGDDAAQPGEDAAQAADATEPPGDASAEADAGAVMPSDSGEVVDVPVYDLGGCGCASTGSGAAMLLIALGALPLATRLGRRRR